MDLVLGGAGRRKESDAQRGLLAFLCLEWAYAVTKATKVWYYKTRLKGSGPNHVGRVDESVVESAPNV